MKTVKLTTSLILAAALFAPALALAADPSMGGSAPTTEMKSDDSTGAGAKHKSGKKHHHAGKKHSKKDGSGTDTSATPSQ
jgi:hypothetical protein